MISLGIALDRTVGTAVTHFRDRPTKLFAIGAIVGVVS